MQLGLDIPERERWAYNQPTTAGEAIGVAARGLADVGAATVDTAAGVARGAGTAYGLAKRELADASSNFLGDIRRGFGASPAPATPEAPAPKPAAPVVTPEAARPNPPAAAPEPAPAPRKSVTRQSGPDTSKYPYGLDLNKLMTMFPEARNAPAAVANGLQVRERRPGQSLAPVVPRAPQRGDNEDLQKRTDSIIRALSGVRGGSGGFGDLMRMRLALGFAGQEMIPIAAERARRNRMYDDAMAAYEAEQGLGLRLADLQLGRDRLDQNARISEAELAQRALTDQRAYDLDRFGSQWDMAKGLLTLEQAERAALAKAQADAQGSYKLYNVQQETDAGNVLDIPHVIRGFDLTTGAPITAPLQRGTTIDDPTAGIY